MQEISEKPTRLLDAVRRSGLGISLFAILSAGIIAITQVNTREQIAANQAAAAARALFEIYPSSIDPELYQHQLQLSADSLGHSAQQVAYQAIEAGQVSGVILPVRTSEGYSGDIDLLVGVNRDGSVGGVRVVTHRETPGLGDNIELAKSDWILSFNGRSRDGSDDPRWAVRKDGGEFDQFTGATITPRAIVDATATALDYFEANRALLLAPVTPQTGGAE
jgi:electron transport complex protein RnfG